MRGPRAPARTAWVDGRLCRGEAATLSLWDRGARDGEGLFETVRVEGGRPRLWSRHVERLVLSAATLGFPVPPSPAVLRAALTDLLAAEGLSDAVARITVTRGIPGGRPSRSAAWIEAEPLAGRLWRGARTGNASAIFSRRPFEPGPLGPHKTTSRLAYHLAREEARAARVDEAILVSPAGKVLEGTVSNVFALIRGEVLTPPLSLGILAGITRAAVLALCGAHGIPARERFLTPSDLHEAEEVFLTNAVQELVPLATLEGRPVRGGATASRLLDAYRAWLATVPEA